MLARQYVDYPRQTRRSSQPISRAQQSRCKKRPPPLDEKNDLIILLLWTGVCAAISCRTPRGDRAFGAREATGRCVPLDSLLLYLLAQERGLKTRPASAFNNRQQQYDNIGEYM